MLWYVIPSILPTWIKNYNLQLSAMPPYPYMPYDYPPAICYALTEICSYILFLLCLYYAWKKGIGQVAYLLGGFGFGLLLEYVNVATNSGYKYGQFWFMLGEAPNNIPVCIGLGWGVIIYTSRLVSDSLRLPLWAAAALDALLALNIDGSMDVVAYRLHMWHWDWASRVGVEHSLTAQWFGVPYGNFYGWLCVVFFYSLFARSLEKIRFQKKPAARFWLALTPLLSILLSQGALWLALFTIAGWLNRQFGITSKERLIALLIILPLLVIAGFRKRISVTPGTLPFISWLIPVWFHVFFFVWLFAGGFHKENIWMTSWCIVNFLIGITITWYLHLRKPQYNTQDLSAV